MRQVELVPELSCADIARSLRFYIDVLGFSILFRREEEGFAYLKRNNAELMLEQPGKSRVWTTAPLEHPYGRGVNFQIEVDDVDELYATVQKNDLPIFLPIEERWYRRDEVLVGNRQFIVQDPDGYLLRLYEDLGTKTQS